MATAEPRPSLEFVETGWVEGSATSARRRTPLAGELLVLAALLVGYDWVRRLASVQERLAVAHGLTILHAENGVDLHLERISNAWLTTHHVLSQLAAGYYQYTHVTAALIVLAAAWIWRPDAYPRARNALVLTNVVALVVFAVYPTAPPRLLPTAGYIDSVARVFGTAGAPIPDQYAALPSLHLAWATWVAVVGGMLVRRRALRWLLWLYPLTTGLVVVATANHYLVDVGTGVAVGLAATWVTGALTVGGRTAPEDARPAPSIP